MMNLFSLFNTIKIFIKWLYFIIWFGYYYQDIKVNRDYAVSLRNKLENLGILGIKIGQYLCNRSDISSDIMKEELVGFLNNNTIHDIKHTNEILKKANIDNIILGDVIGSGSLTQVYRCMLPGYGNSELVLKVKHPEVNNLIKEIYVVKKILSLFSYYKKLNFIINIDWNEFFILLEKQLDLNNERNNLLLYHNIYMNNMNNMYNYDEITIPQYITGNEDFIIMTYCEGKPLNEYNKDTMQYKKAHKLLTCSTIHTFFIHQIIHGDIHCGNILVKDNGNISIIDFGVCINFTEEENKGIYAISRFNSNHNKESCNEIINAIVQPHDIYNNNINLNRITDMIMTHFNTMHEDVINNTTAIDIFNMITKLIRNNNNLIKGNIILYFMNIMLIQGLSPYTETTDVTSYIALGYMKKIPFFVEELDFFLDEYYNHLTNSGMLTPYLQEKYK